MNVQYLAIFKPIGGGFESRTDNEYIWPLLRYDIGVSLEFLTIAVGACNVVLYWNLN